jgi:diguanylate cyclase (GGDEF)-like protein
MASDRKTVSVMALIDLDGFKPINDTFGHAAGDIVLAAVARRLTRVIGNTAFVARMGGDEFALLAEDQDQASAEALATSICAALRRPYRVEGRQFRLSGSCGMSLIQPDERDFRHSLICCDTALYAAKEENRGSVSFFSPAMADSNSRRVAIEGAFRADDVMDQIQLVYQPIYELETGILCSFEALARWSHSDLGPVSPAEFIPIIEQINVIEEVSDFLLRKAASEAVKWPETVSLSFNLSAVQLCSGGTGDAILAILKERGLHPSRLQIEVTETALLADFQVARANLKMLSDAGARIVLDDFGAGYASLSYLREMNFDAIKLDGSLVTTATSSEAAERLLRGVLGLCASLGLPCIAEHIETAEQRAFLQARGCEFGQGYALSQPMDAHKARAMARSKLIAIGSRRRKDQQAAG